MTPRGHSVHSLRGGLHKCANSLSCFSRPRSCSQAVPCTFPTTDLTVVVVVPATVSVRRDKRKRGIVDGSGFLPASAPSRRRRRWLRIESKVHFMAPYAPTVTPIRARRFRACLLRSLRASMQIVRGLCPSFHYLRPTECILVAVAQLTIAGCFRRTGNAQASRSR